MDDYEDWLKKFESQFDENRPVSFDDWLESEVQRLFPDDIDIPAGQLRVRVFNFVWKAIQKQKDLEKK